MVIDPSSCAALSCRFMPGFSSSTAPISMRSFWLIFVAELEAGATWNLWSANWSSFETVRRKQDWSYPCLISWSPWMDWEMSRIDFNCSFELGTMCRAFCCWKGRRHLYWSARDEEFETVSYISSSCCDTAILYCGSCQSWEAYYSDIKSTS